MTSLEAYNEFHILLNKNANYRDVNISKANYVFLFNRESKFQLKDFIEKNNNSVLIYDVQELIVESEVEEVESNDEQVVYKIPTNYLEFIDSSSLAKKDNCFRKITNYLYKPRDNKSILSNAFYSDFDFEESVCNIQSKKLIVYKGEYELISSYLSYYKFVDEIDIEGYYKIDGSISTTINPNISDLLIHRINNWVVLEVMRQFENGNGFKLSQDRIINN